MSAIDPERLPQRTDGGVEKVARKLPHITAVFWALKIAATTLGKPVATCQRRHCTSDIWSAPAFVSPHSSWQRPSS